MVGPEPLDEKSRDIVGDEANPELGAGLELECSEVDESLFEKRRETKFLLKLDASLLVWCWFSYLIKVCLSVVEFLVETVLKRQANRFFELQDCLCFRHEGGCESFDCCTVSWPNVTDGLPREPA
jgi:hypothetical protein